MQISSENEQEPVSMQNMHRCILMEHEMNDNMSNSILKNLSKIVLNIELSMLTSSAMFTGTRTTYWRGGERG
jgi:hypothetical protein